MQSCYFEMKVFPFRLTHLIYVLLLLSICQFVLTYLPMEYTV